MFIYQYNQTYCYTIDMQQEEAGTHKSAKTRAGKNPEASESGDVTQRKLSIAISCAAGKKELQQRKSSVAYVRNSGNNAFCLKADTRCDLVF